MNQKLLTLDDLPKKWTVESTNSVQWVFLDNRESRSRIAVARYLNDNYPHEGWVEYYSIPKENWVVVLDHEQEVTYAEALHYAIVMITLGEAERIWK